eukprot:TRINITY_DN24279_c0_g2_i1.p1 TRINITY_DN24279_c0_g2~~TRINITY_DN24279_c0_g2_i1.p1  ORF type:complete len:988 (-),score=119.08 TRINITY_DN24279_c0_g2_i1:434-3184(-)
MCTAGLNIAVVLETAASPRGEWPELLQAHGCGAGGCKADDLPLWCSRRSEAAQVLVREHPQQVGYALAQKHVDVFRANLDRFDWFMYSEEDIGWTPQSLLSYAAEFDKMRSATPSEFPAQMLPGFIRWEATSEYHHLNDVHARLSSGLANFNRVSEGAIISNDLFWSRLPGVMGPFEINGEVYFSPRNPCQGIWALPKSELSLRWRARIPNRQNLSNEYREFFGSGWLYRCPSDKGCGESGGARKLIPCRRAQEFLVMHMSNGKYAYGDGHWDILPDHRTLGDMLHDVCGVLEPSRAEDCKGPQQSTACFGLGQNQARGFPARHLRNRQVLGQQVGFNPSMVLLPRSLAAQLHPEAVYLATLRLQGNQCKEFGVHQARNPSKLGSALLLLDKSFHTLAAADSILDRNDSALPLWDIRLHIRNSSSLLVSFLIWDTADPALLSQQFDKLDTRNFKIPKTKWHLAELGLVFRDGSLVAHVVPEITLHGQRNIGMMSDHARSQMLLALLPRPKIVPALATDRPMSNTSKLSSFHIGKVRAMHNSVDPLWLESQRLYLGLAHMHLDRNSSNALFGSHYIHQFVLFEPEPPHRIQHVSPSFCFPAPNSAESCEVIQMVLSMIFESDSTDLLFTLGIHDCEAVAVRAPLRGVLAFTRGEHDFRPWYPPAATHMALSGSASDTSLAVFGSRLVKDVAEQCQHAQGRRGMITQRLDREWLVSGETWTSRASYVQFWQSSCAKQVATDLFRESEASSVQHHSPVMHWPCSELLFKRNVDYQLPSLSIVPQLQVALSDYADGHVLVITSLSHRPTHGSMRCSAILDEYLSRLGISYEIREESSPREVISLMRGAPLVIALINSPLSFVAKLENLSEYLVVQSMPNTNTDDEAVVIPWQLEVPSLPHSLFQNYSDIHHILAVIRASA